MSKPLPQVPGREELDNAAWFKSARSEARDGCVEVAHLESWTAVRDSKNPAGQVHLFDPDGWAGFLAGARAGEFDRTEQGRAGSRAPYGAPKESGIPRKFCGIFE